MRQLALILFLFTAAFTSAAEQTNYSCVICGKEPLTGQIWISKWGAICKDCYQLENHCSLCGLPVREDGGTVKTGDGRFICKFDKTNAVLDAATAQDIFENARDDLASLFGPGFALKFPNVTVKMFDVDYWSEKGRGDGLHKFGFCSTRKTPSGKCTHQVVMLSGQLRDDLAMTAAHEYTHLWINENRTEGRVIDGNTIEAICELAAYELMYSQGKKAQMKKILDNPYTHGAVTGLVDVDREHGFRYVMNWVKEGTETNFETTAASAAPASIPVMTYKRLPPSLPSSLKLNGLLVDGKSRSALVNGISFMAGETKSLKLHDRDVQVRCREIQRASVVLEVEGLAAAVPFKIGEEKFLP